MKVLITGASGQVGSALCATAPAHLEVCPCPRAELDVSDAQAVAQRVRALEPAVIVNAAAYTAVDRAEAEPERAQHINADGPRVLADAARDCGARLIHLSTDFVFDGAASRPYRPDARPNPLSVYGRTKLAGEEAVLERLPGRSVILRTAWVYAPRGRNFMLTMLRILRERGVARVVCDQIGTPTAAVSVAEAIWGIIAHPELAGVHHWTDAGVASWYDFAVAIAEEAAPLGLVSREAHVTPIATEDYPTAARRPPFSVLDVRSLHALGLERMHWRARLRAVLSEVRDV